MENVNLQPKKLPKFCQLHYPTDLKRPHTLITPKMLKTALPTMVPIPRSLLVTKVPIILVKNSGALVPVMTSYKTVNNFLFSAVSRRAPNKANMCKVPMPILNFKIEQQRKCLVCMYYVLKK